MLRDSFLLVAFEDLFDVDDKLIVVGGMGLDTNPKDYLMQYDADKDVWKSLAAMPTARYATFSFFIHNKLYVLGIWITF